MATVNPDELGPPDFQLAGLSVWVFGRQFEHLHDYWDGNWLKVLVHCGADGADIRMSGTFLHLRELQAWLDQALALHRNLTGAAELNCLEPYLYAKIELKDGRGGLVIRITPRHLTQKHEFTFAIDQSYLPDLIGALQRLLQRYPVRGKQ